MSNNMPPPITLQFNLPPEWLDSIRGVIREELAAAGTPVQRNPVTEYLTREGVAKAFEISLVTVDAWVKAGKLTAYRIGRKVRFKSSEIDSALKVIRTGKSGVRINHN